MSKFRVPTVYNWSPHILLNVSQHLMFSDLDPRCIFSQAAMRRRFPAGLVAVYLVVSVFVLLGQAEQKAADVEFDNNWDRRLDFECPDGQVITSVYSIHGDKYGDRRFKFGCRAPADGAVADFCGWTPNYVNMWKQPVRFVCPNNFGIAGVSSFHHNYYEDRRWKFKCCRDNGFIETPCALTDYLNDFDQVLNFTAPASDVIRGWQSWYDDEREDRRHKFVTCTVKQGSSNK
ncbi:hemagglutinin/amebocyte aggregation factor-like [Elysia marginata]|uniref:Hemagglutinin/amebocyte aggregation factor-like n=1 Tax=Elysia marginata TaxID=1093978 RepID=A0AAV4G9F8_9GAST|nr:hemagglutinin/amebocyte aggregation factor-like [Elysia marginata]